MALKFFLMSAGGLLGGAVILWLLIKQFAPGFTDNVSRPVVYGFVSSALTAILAYCVTLITNNLFVVFWILGIAFLLFGMVHMLIMHKKFKDTGGSDNPGKLLIAEFFFAGSLILFTLVVFASMQYFLRDKSFLFYPMLMASLAFFIPFLLAHTFDAAMDIPEAVFTTWEYPLGKSIDPPPEKENERLLVIGFEIAKKGSDVTKTYFRARSPEEIKLGELFYHFINDYNDLHSETPIQFMEREDESYKWWFRRKPKWYQGQQILDPFLTIRGNGIKENAVIICERITTA